MDEEFKPFQFTDQDLKNAEAKSREILAQMEKGKSFQEAAKLTPEFLEQIYSQAFGYYNQGKSKEATALFQFLFMAAPTIYKYVYGLGASLYQAKAYREASLTFAMALEIEQHPDLCLYLAECLMEQGLVDEALESLNFAIELCTDSETDQQWKERALLIKATLAKKS